MAELIEQTGSPQDNSKSGTETIRVLLVDDEEAYVDVLSNRLGKRGFEVAKSHTSAETLQNLRRNEYDVAVLDLKMPDMDGIEILKIIKLMDPRMQVIMLTGHGSTTACKKGFELGAFDYLTKPCELDTLIRKIRQAFQKRQQMD
jgi:DNA-binding NtrC family response regulator